jgi:hypothetical protein
MMAIDFSAVEATIAQTKVEVAEAEAATAVLIEAKSALAVIQESVAVAQAAVAAASESAGLQKSDVVNGITAAITALQELLAQLQ